MVRACFNVTSQNFQHQRDYRLLHYHFIQQKLDTLFPFCYYLLFFVRNRKYCLNIVSLKFEKRHVKNFSTTNFAA